MRFRSLFAGGLAAAIGVAAGLSHATADDAWAGSADAAAAIEQLHKNAVAAGKSEVVIYGAYSVVFQQAWEIFTARFPEIKVVGNPLRGSELMARVEAETVSGQRIGDMIMSGMTDLITIAAGEAGAAYQAPNIGTIPAEFHDPNGKFHVVFADTAGMGYNKGRLSEADLPKTMSDLTDPKYKGMLFDDPAGNAITTLSWVEHYTAGRIDEEWMKTVIANGIIVPTATPYFNNLATGSIAFMPFAAHSRILRLQEGGANVGFHGTPGLITPLLAGTVILEGAPNREAAELLQAWMLTPEAQAAIVRFGLNYPMLPGTPIPAEWTPLEEITKALPPVPPADYLAAKTKLLEVVGKLR